MVRSPSRQDRTKESPMSANPVLWDLDARGVATVTLNRPEVNNAYDAGLIGGVLAAMDELGKKPSLRRGVERERQAFSGRRRSEMDQRRAAEIGRRERGGVA